MTRTIISWNVNGLRQRHERNEFLKIFETRPDIVCIQEAKTSKVKIHPEIKRLSGYHIHCAPVPEGEFNEVMLISREKPQEVIHGFGIPELDDEGRFIIADFSSFILMNCYFPLGVGHADTLEHELAFYDAFLASAADLAGTGSPVIICGDFSIAHSDDDVESVKKHAARQVGTTHAEREKMDALIRLGYTDAFRMFHLGKGNYTWWPNGFHIPERHLGRRLDYFFVNDPAKATIAGNDILADVEGSDHCPIRLETTL
ncbi:MAG: exodeoxyribonuclease III [Methanoregula sp.]|jgi:exodeoxyribonuclease-3|nr:exodeoxyribonuclease III [Methanoregula sp.]